MSELKPCPFCGADGDDIEYRLICSGIIQNFMLLRCRKCNAILLDMNDNHCPNDLKQKWNTRVISTTIQPSEHGTNLAEVGTDCISRQAAIGALRNYLVGKNVPCDGTLTCRLIENEVISKLPSAQPEQRYTEEELRVFKHGISLSLLSKRSAQHWRYDEDMATEIKFLERLYDKVVADMGGEQDE